MPWVVSYNKMIIIEALIIHVTGELSNHDMTS